MVRFDLSFRPDNFVWSALVLLVMTGCFGEMQAEVRCDTDRDCFIHQGEYCAESGRCSVDEEVDVGSDDVEEEQTITVTARIPDASGDKAPAVCAGPFDEGDQRWIIDGEMFVITFEGEPPVQLRISRNGYQTKLIDIEDWEVSGLVIEMESCEDVECTNDPRPCFEN